MHNIFPVNTPPESDLTFLDFQAEYQATRSNHHHTLLSLSEVMALDKVVHYLPRPSYDTESEPVLIYPTLDETIQTCTALEVFHVAVMVVMVEMTGGRLHPHDRYVDKDGRFLTLDQLKEHELIHQPKLLNNTLYHYLRQSHRHLHSILPEIKDLPNYILFHVYRDCLWAAVQLLTMFYGDCITSLMVKSMLTTLLNQKHPRTMLRCVCERRGVGNFKCYLERLPQ